MADAGVTAGLVVGIGQARGPLRGSVDAKQAGETIRDVV